VRTNRRARIGSEPSNFTYEHDGKEGMFTTLDCVAMFSLSVMMPLLIHSYYVTLMYLVTVCKRRGFTFENNLSLMLVTLNSSKCMVVG
jgi:hypothetical protein